MNRKISSIAIAASVLGGAAVGSTLVGTAGAYGSDDTPAPETDVNTQNVSDGDFIPVQDGDPTDGAENEQPGRRGQQGGCNLDAVAEAIGIDVDSLRAELDAGSSIADVATANGADIDTVVDAMLSEKQERIEAAVDAGDLTDEEADVRLDAAEDHALDRINRVRGEVTADA